MKKLLCRVAILTLLVIQAKSLNLSSNTKLLSASLYKQIIKNDNKNICFSPLSAEIALAVLYVGARGETATEIRKVLQFPSSENHIEEAFKKFLKSIISTEDFSLHIANRIYFEAYLPVNIVFARVAKLAFEADMGNVDFSNTTRAAQTINQWVEAQTQNKIQNLVNPNNLKSNTVALLINALYLKAKWEHEFDKRETSKVKFYKGNDETVEVDGMSFFINDKSFKYAENDAIDAKILELSFKNQSAGNSMVIILPNNKTGLEKIEKNLDVALTIQLKEDIVEVMLPKFKVENQLDLKGILQNLGIHKAFINGEADLSGIFGQKGDIYIDDAIQKSYVNIDEGGVEAAAATVIGAISPSLPPPATKSFIVNRPFIFYIQVENVIVFMGKIVDPSL